MRKERGFQFSPLRGKPDGLQQRTLIWIAPGPSTSRMRMGCYVEWEWKEEGGNLFFSLLLPPITYERSVPMYMQH